jgi:hypothetical protein
MLQSSGYELSKLEIIIRQGQDVSCVTPISYRTRDRPGSTGKPGRSVFHKYFLTSPPSSIDANRNSAVAVMTSAMGIDLPPPVPGTMGFADQEPESVSMEVTDRTLGKVAKDEEDEEDDDSDDESVQSIDKWHVEPFDMTTMPAPLSRSELSKRIVKEAKHLEIDLEWLCCPNPMIPIIEPTLKEYDEDDDEIAREDIDYDNQQEQRHVKRSNVERLTKIAKLRNLPPCPWLDESGELKSSWITMSGVEIEVMTSLSKESPESHQVHEMFLNRLENK